MAIRDTKNVPQYVGDNVHRYIKNIGDHSDTKKDNMLAIIATPKTATCWHHSDTNEDTMLAIMDTNLHDILAITATLKRITCWRSQRHTTVQVAWRGPQYSGVERARTSRLPGLQRTVLCCCALLYNNYGNRTAALLYCTNYEHEGGGVSTII